MSLIEFGEKIRVTSFLLIITSLELGTKGEVRKVIQNVTKLLDKQFTNALNAFNCACFGEALSPDYMTTIHEFKASS